MLLIGFILLLHSAFSFSKYIRYKKIINEDYSMPKDIIFELIASFCIIAYGWIYKFNKLSSIKDVRSRKSFESSFKGIKKFNSNKSNLMNLLINTNHNEILEKFLKKVNN